MLFSLLFSFVGRNGTVVKDSKRCVGETRSEFKLEQDGSENCSGECDSRAERRGMEQTPDVSASEGNLFNYAFEVQG